MDGGTRWGFGEWTVATAALIALAACSGGEAGNGQSQNPVLPVGGAGTGAGVGAPVAGVAAPPVGGAGMAAPSAGVGAGSGGASAGAGAGAAGMAPLAG